MCIAFIDVVLFKPLHERSIVLELPRQVIIDEREHLAEFHDDLCVNRLLAVLSISFIHQVFNCAREVHLVTLSNYARFAVGIPRVCFIIVVSRNRPKEVAHW